MKYKVGDRVRIKSLDWYNENKNEFGDVKCSLNCSLTKAMSIHCGSILTVEKLVDGGIYWMEENQFNWADEMIECKVEEEVGLVDNFSSRWVNEFNLPDGYIFKDENGNVINATKIVLEKKKKEYPKTYCECKDILGLWDIDDTECGYYKTDLIDKLQMLLICRDAYWKIAGEEMRLGKPWKARWSDNYQKKWIINFYQDEINLTNGPNVHFVLAFPTEEMRDAFYENFKEEIEFCKELL